MGRFRNKCPNSRHRRQRAAVVQICHGGDCIASMNKEVFHRTFGEEIQKVPGLVVNSNGNWKLEVYAFLKANKKVLQRMHKLAVSKLGYQHRFTDLVQKAVHGYQH